MAVQIEFGRSEGATLEADGTPIFLDAGDPVVGEYLCAECGYGVTVRVALPACPMCHGTVWEAPSASPYSRSLL